MLLVHWESRLSHTYCDVTHFIWHTLCECMLCVCTSVRASELRTNTQSQPSHTHTLYKHFWGRNFLTDFAFFLLFSFTWIVCVRVCVLARVCVNECVLTLSTKCVQLLLFAKSGLKGSQRRANLGLAIRISA